MSQNLEFFEIVALSRARKREEEGSEIGPDEKHASRPFPEKSGKNGEICERLGRK
jgi:hypothetical protein